jgi:hypothetical protein
MMLLLTIFWVTIIQRGGDRRGSFSSFMVCLSDVMVKPLLAVLLTGGLLATVRLLLAACSGRITLKSYYLLRYID